MKRTILILTALIAAHGAFAADAISKDYRKFTNSRRYCVSRKTVGDNVITVWYRNGKPDWVLPSVTTNKVKHIVGKEQNNPIQNELEIAEVDAKKARKVEKSAEQAKKKDQKTYENWVKDTKKARSKSSTEEMTAFYDSILELIGEAD